MSNKEVRFEFDTKKTKIASQQSYSEGNPTLPQPRFKLDYDWESNPALPQPGFKRDRRMYRYITMGELSVLKKEV